MDIIKMDLPSNPQYLQMLRLTTASLANKMGYDIELIEDMKVVVTEIFTYLITDNDRIEVDFKLNEDNLTIDFKKEFIEKEEGLNTVSLELKKQILLSLADELNFGDDKITVVINKA